MPTPFEILTNFLLPALIAAVGLSVPWWRKWAGAAAISAGFAVAFRGVRGAPPWPPGTGDAIGWLVWFTIPVAILGTIDALIKLPLWARVGATFALLEICIPLLNAPLMSHGAGAAFYSEINWIHAWSIAAVGWWLALELMTQKRQGPLPPIVLTLLLAGVAAMLAISSNVKASQMAVSLTLMSFVTIGAAWWFRTSLHRVVVAFAFPAMGLLLYTHLYSYTEPPLIGVGLILIAPLLYWLADLPGLRRLKPWQRLTLRIVPVLLAVGLAVGITARQFLAPTPKNPSHTSNNEDY